MSAVELDLAHGVPDPDGLRQTREVALDARHAPPGVLDEALVCLRDAVPLRTLRLRSELRAMPPALCELTRLQHLAIHDPMLPGLPAGIARLERLRSLRLTTQRLASLPRSLGALHRLRELYVDSHQLVGLPAQLPELAQLESLGLRLHHVYVHDWEHPADVPSRFARSPAKLCALLAMLPRLSTLLLSEHSGTAGSWVSQPVFSRFPEELALLPALEALALFPLPLREPLPPGRCLLPSLRRLLFAGTWPLPGPDALRVAFPRADLLDRDTFFASPSARFLDPRETT